MRVATQQLGSVAVVSLSGDLDARTAPATRAQVSQVLARHSSVLLDLSDVAYVSSAGLRALLLLYRRVQATGGAIVLVGVPPALHTVLSATGFLGFFKIADTVTEGVDRLEADEQSGWNTNRT